MTLSTQSLTKSFGRKRVLEDINCTFPVGLTLLTGPSGAGKSTLLRILATADRPSAGTLSWNGRALPAARAELRRTLGYAPQAVDFPEDLTGREFGMHIAALKGLDRKQADAQFLEIVEELGLFDDIANPIMAYSGGMRRRLTVAQALLGEPELIALDEPTAELDGDSAAAVHVLVLARAARAVVVMTSHLAEDLTAHAAQVLRVADGQVVAVS